jgi:voltage-gated potassium channel
MKEETRKNLRELKVTIIIIIIFLIAAALIISIYSKVGLANAFEMAFTQMLTAGTGGVFGNIIYVVIIFFTLGITFYMFEKVIILLSELRIGGIVMSINLSSIKDHYIVCGAGRVGIHVANKLKKDGKKVVIIETDCQKVDSVREKGFIAIEGDCMAEEVLEKARIREAKGIVACTGEDNKNVFLVLTAKDMNPRIKVATRVNDLKVTDEFVRAGADIIVAPEVTGGYELADKILGLKK